MPTRTPKLLAGATGLAVALLTIPLNTAAHAQEAAAFHRLATFPVYLNSSADAETVAEISAVTDDGNTVVYTDSPGERLGFVDITDPGAPQPAGTLDLAGEPTSVAVAGDLILAVVNTSADYVDTSGQVVVLSAATREIVDTIELGGQPDSIAVDADDRHAAVAIENERDEDLGDGGLPQDPPGWLSIIDLTDLSVTDVGLTGLADESPSDPEPEYVAINSRGQAVVTLQENNHIVLVDVATASVTGDFSAGTATVTDVDVAEDDIIDPSGAITAPREPDAVAWIGDDHIATANEGDWKGGTRGWTVFDADGTIVADAGAEYEHLAVSHGLYPEGRSENKGVEPEGLTVGTFGGTPYMFVASERGNFVAAYDVSDPAAPRYTQMLPANNGPEGLLTVPSRELLIVSTEEDMPDEGIRASVQLFGFGPGEPAFPSIVSDEVDGVPIGWGTLSGLTAVPSEPDTLVAVTDSAYAHTRLLTIDVSSAPARITEAVQVTKDGSPVGYDGEGVFARPDGGYWLAGEGDPDDDVPNLLVRLSETGAVVEEVELPDDVADAITGNGLEGVTATGTGDDEVVWAAVQRPLDGEDFARIGRYEVATGEWSWLGYELTAAPGGAWVGLSEITAVSDGTLAVIERDNLRGPAAQVKQVTTVDVDAVQAATDGTPALLAKRPIVDALPALRDGHGWTQDKLEGLAIAGNGRVYAVTDNDAVDDATGETVFADLGSATDLFGPDYAGGDDSSGKLPVTGSSLAVTVAAAAAAVVGGGALFIAARRRRATGHW